MLERFERAGRLGAAVRRSRSCLALAHVVRLPLLPADLAQRVSSALPAVLPVQRSPLPVQRGPRHDLRFQQGPLPRWILAMSVKTQARNNVSALELKRPRDVYCPTASMWPLDSPP